ncbi:hypothetical protein AB0I10_03150 [Streptomyces sp. NPDC050636]
MSLNQTGHGLVDDAVGVPVEAHPFRIPERPVVGSIAPLDDPELW